MRGKGERGERGKLSSSRLFSQQKQFPSRGNVRREKEREKVRERERENVGREGERGKKKERGRNWRRKGDMFPIILIISCIFISARGINVII